MIRSRGHKTTENKFAERFPPGKSPFPPASPLNEKKSPATRTFGPSPPAAPFGPAARRKDDPDRGRTTIDIKCDLGAPTPGGPGDRPGKAPPGFFPFLAPGSDPEVAPFHGDRILLAPGPTPDRRARPPACGPAKWAPPLPVGPKGAPRLIGLAAWLIDCGRSPPLKCLPPPNKGKHGLPRPALAYRLPPLFFSGISP